jgi:glycosyltransferase involved in cell wall biosynthesis
VLDAWDVPANGLVVSSRRFADALRVRNHRVDVFAGGIEQPGKVVMPALRLPFIQSLVEQMGFPLARTSRRLLESRLADYDVVHVQAPFFLGWGAVRAAKKLGIPLVVSFHVQPENMLRSLGMNSALVIRWLYRLFVRAIYNKADLVICPSPLAKELLLNHGLESRARVISNGIPDEFYVPPGPRGDGSQDPVVLLAVGRLADEKRQDVIIEAVRRCRHKERIQLVLAGRGPKVEEIRRQAQSLPIPPLIGSQSDEELKASYARATIFVHAGEVELESLTTLEAMAAGCPVLIADSPASAARQFAVSPDMLFPPGDAEALSACISRLIEDPDRRGKIGAEYRQNADSYSIARSAERLENEYGSIIDSRARQGASQA